MKGAIIGDIIGSSYEWNNVKTTKFELFPKDASYTDDSVLTLAVADAILHNKTYLETIRHWGQTYFHAGYGGSFKHWLTKDDPAPYNSWGNGSAMRVSPVGWAFNDIDTVLNEAKKSAEITHNHPEGIKGAQAVASAVFLARTGNNKDTIKKYIKKQFSYNLDRTIAAIRPRYSFDVSCSGSVPEAIIAFLESRDFEDAVRKAVSLGGDSDTIACIAGGIAHAFYKNIPENIEKEAITHLPPQLKDIYDAFEKKYLQ